MNHRLRPVACLVLLGAVTLRASERGEEAIAEPMARAESAQRFEREFQRRFGVPRSTMFRRQAAVGALERAAERERARRALHPTDASWVSLGPHGTTQGSYSGSFPGANDSGLVNAIAIHPADPGTVFVGPAGGGVWRTTDAGASWTPLTDDIGTTAIGAIAIAPSDPRRVYAGCGSGRQLFTSGTKPPGAGLLVSRDGGDTWALSASSPGEAFWFLHVDPANPDILLAGTDRGLQRSTDAGATWTQTLASGDARATSIAAQPGNPSLLLVSTFRWGPGDDEAGTSCTPVGIPRISGRVWRSTDRGVSFVEITTFPPAGRERARLELAFAPSDPARVYALASRWLLDTRGCYRQAFALLEDVMRSTDAGLTWAAMGQGQVSPNTLGGILTAQLDYDMVLSVDPRNPDVVWAGGIDETRSTDGGLTWKQVSAAASGSVGKGLPYVHADQHFHAWAPDGSILYIGNDGGIFSTRDDGATFRDLNRGLATHQFYSVCQTPAAPDQVAGGAQDNGTSLTRDGRTWTQVLAADGLDCVMHPTNRDVMVGTWQGNSYFRTTNGGATWRSSGPAIAREEQVFSTPLYAVNGEPAHFYTFDRHALWESIDGAASWKRRSAPAEAAETIGDIGIFSGNPSRMVMGLDDGMILVSADGGTNWTRVGAITGAAIGTVRFDRGDASTIWATSLRSDPGAEHLFVSHDGGATFTPLSRTGQPGGLPDVPTEQIEQDPVIPNILYVTNWVGVYRSIDAGATWQRFGVGLPNVWPRQIAILPDGSKIRLATFGRGMWEIALEAQTAQHAPRAAIDVPAASPTLDAGIAAAFHGIATDPDAGDVVTGRWDFGDGMAASGDSATHFFAVPGTYPVTFTVTDSSGLSDSASMTVRVRAPEGSVVAGPDLLVPVVLDVFGAAGSHYTTELTLASRAASPVTVLLQYTASQGGGSGWASVTLAPGELRIIPDAVAFLKSRGLPIPDDGARIGTLRATFAGAASAREVFAGGRTSTPGETGSFGLFYTASALSTSTATVFGLQQNAAQRSNLALVNAGEDAVTLRVRLFGPRGEELGTATDRTLPGRGWAQMDAPLAGKAESGRALVTRVAGSSPFSAYGVLNDAKTSDGSFVTPLVPRTPSSADLLVPIVLRVGGYRSELTLANLSPQPLVITLSFVGSPQLSALGTGSVEVTLAAGEQRIFGDAIALLATLGLSIPPSGDAGGTLLVRPPAGIPGGAIAAGVRTFTAAPGGGTFGLFYPGLTLEESATTAAWVDGLQQNEAQRSNLAIANRGDADDAVTLRVTFFGADGAALEGPETATLAPGEWKQFNQPLASRSASAGSARIERLSGSSRWIAYGVLNDQRNSDGSYIPMSP